MVNFDNKRVVPNHPIYYDFIRDLRNTPECSKGFIEQIYITPEMQVEYMKKYKDNYFICLVDGIPAGYVGVIDNDIRVCTAPGIEKRGVGTFMLDYIKEAYPNATARVKEDNEASVALFKKSGIPYELI